MFKALATRWRQGRRTIAFPPDPPGLPDRFQGRPTIEPQACPTHCGACQPVCPTQAVTVADNRPRLDMGRCLFCGDCVDACPHGVLHFGKDYRLAARHREDMVIADTHFPRAGALDKDLRRILGRSLALRQVSAGGCNACEADVNVLGTITYDLSRFGVTFTASPRHADGLLITGPVSQNMAEALKSTYEAVPDPKIVIAVGACAISGGIYAGHPETSDGCAALVPVDLYVPGCPPHPFTILDGVLRLINRIQ